MPTAERVARCSSTTPAYDSGIDQPPNSAILAPSRACRSASGPGRSGDLAGVDRLRSRAATLPGSGLAFATMTRISLTNTPLAQLNVDALIVGVASKGSSLVLVPGAADVDKAMKKRLADALTPARRDRQGRARSPSSPRSARPRRRWSSRSVSAARARADGRYPHEAVRRRGRRRGAVARRHPAGRDRARRRSTATATPATCAPSPRARVLGGYAFTKYRTRASSQDHRRAVTSAP